MADPIDTGKKTVTGRTIWRDPETGEDYSERSTTFEIDGKHYTMPTVAEDGTQYTEDQIRDYVKKYGPSDYITGEELPEFKNREDAIEYAISRSDTRKQKEEPMLEEQMELFNEGGLKDEGGSVDPVSGNDVPVGSTKKEVRDDIPAMLSEGEFVFPADVTRFIGLEKLMEQRQEAKMGLKTMEAMGQMGNSEEATMPDDMPFGPADLVILGRPEEDEPKEMYGGGMVYANQGTFATGIGGYQPSVFQGQPQTSAPYVPPSSVAPPPPAPSPAGGYMPKFMGAFDDGSLAPKTTTGTTGTTTTNNTGTTGTTNDFVTTVDKVYTQKEYFNPETGETRMINFYNDVAVNEIPEGFVLKEDYVKDETTTTDLESTSVDSTRVTGDDKSSDKIRLSNMTRQQSSNALSSLKNADPDAILDAWNKNQKTKAVMTSLALINPIVGMAGRAAASHFGNQLEKLMNDKKIAIPKQTEEKQNFIEKLGSGISNFFTGEEEGSTYASTYRPENSPLGMNADRNLLTSTNTGSMFTTSEAQAYDNAINSGNVDVARHYEIVNNRYNKMADFAAGKSVSGLNKYDKEQARSLFDSKGNRQFDTVNQANKDADSKIQKIAAANAEKIAAANLDNRKSDPKLANKKSTSTTSSEKNFVEKVFDSISSFFKGGSDDD